MNSKEKMKKNVTRLVALALAFLIIIGLFASFAKSPNAGFDYSEGLTDKGFFEDVNAQECVTLPDYKSYTMPKDKTVATEEEITEQIDAIKANFTTQEKDVDTDRAVVDGDIVNIDYVGKIDGKEFEGGTTNGKGSDVKIGSKDFIPGFLEQIVGHKPGETFDIDVKFPEDYHMEELKGKDAVFTITVNHYYKDIVPEITDEFVEKNLGNFYKTVEELEAGLEDKIIQSKTKNYVWDKLLKETEVTTYPESMIAYEKEYSKAYVEKAAAQYGMTAEDFVKLVGMESVERYLESMTDDIKETVKAYLTVQAICEKDGIEVTDEDITEYFKEFYGTEDYKPFENVYGKPYLKLSVLREKMIDTIIEDMEVVETPAE